MRENKAPSGESDNKKKWVFWKWTNEHYLQWVKKWVYISFRHSALHILTFTVHVQHQLSLHAHSEQQGCIIWHEFWLKKDDSEKNNLSFVSIL